MPYMGRVASSSGLIRTFLPPSVTRLAAKIGLINLSKVS